MATGSTGDGNELEAGFAKLEGEDFEYYMQTYSIMLGRNSTTSVVDLDLFRLGGGKNVSRHHARIFYDFKSHRFVLDVIGRSGCFVEGVQHLPGNRPVTLNSQDLLQIGEKEFYFLLPTRSILAAIAAARQAPVIPGHPRLSGSNHHSVEANYGWEGDGIGRVVNEGGKKGKKKNKKPSDKLHINGGHRKNVEITETLGEGNRSEKIRGGMDIDNKQTLEAEEKEVMSSVGTVLSDLCGPGEWMPMEKLHEELMEQFGNVWPPRRARKYLTKEGWSPVETMGRSWYGLLVLLRKFPEHFVIKTRSKGSVKSDIVSLVSLLS